MGMQLKDKKKSCAKALRMWALPVPEANGQSQR
jgi:hypothetical protein